MIPSHLEKAIRPLISCRRRLLMVNMGIVYLWFGGLKLFPGVSPAEMLAIETLDKLTWGLVPTSVSYFLLAVWEVSLGVSLILNFRKKIVFYLALIHILFTFTPLFLLPSATFQSTFYTLTLTGQYIVKNLILFSALLFVFPASPPVQE